jgi:2-dehydropantoate 2-reductase
VRPAGEGKIILGDHPGLDPLASLLRKAGFDVESVSDPSSVLWGKLVVSAAINPLTAILDVTNGALVERPSAHLLMAAAAREAASVAARRGIRLPYADPAAEAEAVARRTAGNISSMLQDVRRGAPTEVEAICGAIVQAGEEANQPTPVNQALWMLVKAIGEGKGKRDKG